MGLTPEHRQLLWVWGNAALVADGPGILDLWKPLTGFELEMKGPLGMNFLEGR